MDLPETITIELTVDDKIRQWVADNILDRGLFTRFGIGYWAYGEQVGDKAGWLIYVDPTGEGQEPPGPSGEDDLDYPALDAWQAWTNGEKLPEDWYTIGPEQTIEVIRYGVKRYGAAFLDDEDGEQLDVAIQHVLFGKVVFG